MFLLLKSRIYQITVFSILCFKLSSQNYYDLGVKEYFRGRDSNALNYFDLAIANKQNISNAYMMRCAVNTMLSNYVAATFDIKKAISLDSNNAKAYFYYGRIYFLQKFYGTAIKYYTISISKNNTEPDVYDDRAMCYLFSEKYSLAIQDEDRAILLNPNNEIYYNARGFSKLKQRKYTEAIKDFDYSLKLKPTANAYANKGLVFFELKQYENAITHFTKSLLISKDDKEVLYYRGICYLRTNKNNLGCEDLNKSALLNYDKSKIEIITSCSKK